MIYIEILGYAAYLILILLALIFALGVRLELGIGASTIVASLFFTLSAIIIPVIKASFFNAIWVIPAGYLIGVVVAYALGRFAVFRRPIILIGSIYAGMLRIGIDKDKIKKAQQKATFEAIERWSKDKDKKT